MRVVLEFVDLAKIGTSIQEAIRDQILAMTGNHAKTIDVVIDDIKMDSGDEIQKKKTGRLPKLLGYSMPDILKISGFGRLKMPYTKNMVVCVGTFNFSSVSSLDL